jgi:hypothetical protein
MTPAITVKVELIGVIRDLVRDRVVEIEFTGQEDVTYGDVLARLVERVGPAFRSRLYGPQGLLSIVKIYAHGKMIKNLDETLAADGEQAVRIIVFAAAGGG